MSKNQLYNKYRPHCFLDVIGQQFVVKTLVNAIKTNHLAHAYIFCGPRGIGKTSIARIFAKAINCLNPKNGDCCNQCDHCKIFENNHNIDVIEVDAASTGGVKEVEEITKNLYLSPTQLKYKVVIFDEAHMMSKEA
jgi:DNA polymerase-3 subunit gamma/tau